MDVISTFYDTSGRCYERFGNPYGYEITRFLEIDNTRSAVKRKPLNIKRVHSAGLSATS